MPPDPGWTKLQFIIRQRDITSPLSPLILIRLMEESTGDNLLNRNIAKISNILIWHGNDIRLFEDYKNIKKNLRLYDTIYWLMMQNMETWKDRLKEYAFVNTLMEERKTISIDFNI